MKKFAIASVVVVILAVGWFFVSPLFIDRTVDEEFDFTVDGGGVDMEVIMSMPEEARMANKDAIMAEAANAPDATANEAMPDNIPAVLAQGRFVDADAVHKGSGLATLYRVPGDRHVVRFEDFRTTNGPALVVYLAKHENPTEADHVTDAGYVSLGKLKGNVGNQNYDVPADVDVNEYNSVVVWCELFGVLFSPASLSRSLQ